MLLDRRFNRVVNEKAQRFLRHATPSDALVCTALFGRKPTITRSLIFPQPLLLCLANHVSEESAVRFLRSGTEGSYVWYTLTMIGGKVMCSQNKEFLFSYDRETGTVTWEELGLHLKLE